MARLRRRLGTEYRRHQETGKTIYGRGSRYWIWRFGGGHELCLDRKTGKTFWIHRSPIPIWKCFEVRSYPSEY